MSRDSEGLVTSVPLETLATHPATKGKGNVGRDRSLSSFIPVPSTPNRRQESKVLVGWIGLSRFTYSQLVERDRSGTRRLTMISSMLRGRVWVWGQGLEEEIIGNRWKELDYGGEVPSFIPFLTSPSSSVHDGLFEGRWKLLGLKSIFYFQLMIFYNNFHLPPFLTLRSRNGEERAVTTSERELDALHRLNF